MKTINEKIKEIRVTNDKNWCSVMEDFKSEEKWRRYNFSNHKWKEVINFHPSDKECCSSYYISKNRYITQLQGEDYHLILTALSPKGGNVHTHSDEEWDFILKTFFDNNISQPCIILLSSVEGTTADYHIHIMTDEEKEFIYNTRMSNDEIRKWIYDNNSNKIDKKISIEEMIEKIDSGEFEIAITGNQSGMFFKKVISYDGSFTNDTKLFHSIMKSSKRAEKLKKLV